MTHPYTRLFPKTVAPTVDDDETLGYEIGDVWHHASGSAYDCRDASEGAAVWEERGSGGSSDWGDIGGDIDDQTDLKAELDAKIPTSFLDTDITLAANSDVKIASQKATKAYVDNSVVGLLDLKGSTDCSSNPNYPAALKGDAYYVTVAGKIGGASGESVQVGDVYVASADNAGGTEASVGTSWFVLENNLQGASIAAAIAIAASKTAIVGADSVGGIDSENSNAFVRFTHTNIRTFGRALYDTLYAAIAHVHNYIPSDGWIAGTGTWSYVSADDPIFVASVPDADAALFGVGARFKLTQTSVKYFIVHAKGSPSGGFTPVTIHGGADYDLANAAITSPFFSPVKAPLNFPMDDDKWTVTASNNVNAHKTPPASTTAWFGGALLTNTGISIDVPIGAWRGFGKTILESEDTTVTDFNCYVTFSTANNSESDASGLHTTFIALTAPSGSYKIWQPVELPIKVTVAAKTTMYLNLKSTVATCDAIHMRGDVVPTIIKLVDNYL